MTRNRVRLAATVLAVGAWASPAPAETVNCTNITALPATITVPGVYCLKQDLATSMTSGNAITIAANSVTIDFNGYKLGGLGAGPGTEALGIYAQDRKNITIRNGNIRGFYIGVRVGQTPDSGLSSGHVIEDNLLEANTDAGIEAAGAGVVIRRNRVVNTTKGEGILVYASNSQVIDNFVAATNSNDRPGAIFVGPRSSNVEVARNTLFDFYGYYNAAGIMINSVNGAAHTVADNTIAGAASVRVRGYGIYVLGGSAICRDNTVASVQTTPTFGCTAESGTFPPP